MAHNTIGIDIGGTNLKAAWVEDNRITSELIERDTPTNLTEFKNVMWDMLKTLNVNEETRLGFSIPGVVDYQNQIIKLCPNLEFLNGLPVKEVLNRENCIAGNDADMALLGEICTNNYWDLNLALISLGTGIGSSYYIGNSSPWQSNLISEIGHIKVASNGNQCTCGGVDCLETYFSGWALLSQAKKANLVVNNVYDLFNLTQNSNQTAIDIVNHSIVYLGIAISDLVNLTGISKIILSGKISHSYDIFKDTLIQSITNSLHPYLKEYFSIEKSNIINQSAIIGSVARFE